VRRVYAIGVLLMLLAGIGPRPAVAQDQTAPFFDDTVLQDIRLWINSKDWETLKTNFLSNAYYPADYIWQGITVSNIGIRSRGNGSRSGVKPGLRVDFDRYASGQRFLGLKSVVLRNNTQDPSNLHERVAMAFFRRMGLPASREAHARLFVNDQFAGVYTIVESVDKDFLDRNFGESQGFLYDYDYDPEDLPYYFESRGTDPALYVPKPFKPETNDSNPRPDVIESLVRTINTAGANFRDAIAEFIDLAAFIRHVAAEVFLADQDGVLGDWGMNNFYLYRPPTSNRFSFIVWDKSNAFVGGSGYPIWHNITDRPEESRNRLMSRALEHADLRALYLDTLAAAAASAGEVPADAAPGDTRGWLEREIERMYGQIQPAVLADPTKPYSNEVFEASVEELRVFARARGAYVTTEVAASRLTP
jgi:hypothetical protein